MKKQYKKPLIDVIQVTESCGLMEQWSSVRVHELNDSESAYEEKPYNIFKDMDYGDDEMTAE